MMARTLLSRSAKGDIMKKHRVVFALLCALACGVASQATATSLTFSFDQVAISGSQSNGLGKTGGDSTVESYMDAILGSIGASVDASGALATATYNGENHVNGDTLGTSNNGVHHSGSPDTFLMNDDFGIYGSATDRFSLSFTGFYIYSVSFDWEIFPDASCPASTAQDACANNVNNANYPDIQLLANGASVWSTLATTPSSGDKDPQALGHLSSFALNGVSTLTFVDWPAEIGIDYLVIDGCTIKSPNCVRQDVPEPGTLLLLAAGALAVWRMRKRNQFISA